MEINEITAQKKLQKIDIKNWVTKSNELIESTYKLSLQEQRMLLVMASKVQPGDDKLQSYRFRARDFIEIIGNKKGTGFYSYLKETVKGLQSKTLTIKRGGVERDYSWVITSIYEQNEGFITLQFHPDLKDFLLELKEKFTTYQLENVVKLKSIYSIRIYELLKQYERLKKRELSIQDLRSLLGIESTKYKQYGHFKNKVLLTAQTEINECTDIQFEFTEIKSGRKVTGIEFHISGKESEKRKVLPPQPNEDIKQIKELGKQLGLNLQDKQIIKWLEYGKDTLVGLMTEMKYKSDINNPIGFINSVLPTKEAPAALSNEDKAIREFIMFHLPKKKVEKLEVIPEWRYMENALKTFQNYMSFEEAFNLWEERKNTILGELEKEREKMVKSS